MKNAAKDSIDQPTARSIHQFTKKESTNRLKSEILHNGRPASYNLAIRVLADLCDFAIEPSSPHCPRTGPVFSAGVEYNHLSAIRRDP